MKISINGRLCLAGEHSDWASEYKSINKKIIPGKSIVLTINQNISADVKQDRNIVIEEGKKFEISTDLSKLKKYYESHEFYSYCIASAYIMIKNYNVKGIHLKIESNLPMKKGLASSAAICLLVIRAYNKAYKLNLTVEEEMSYAYETERLLGIKCGKLDQLSAYGKGIMTIDYKDNSIDFIQPKKNMYFVYADLKGEKNTKIILESLNKIYPYSKNLKETFGHLTLGLFNRIIVNKIARNIKLGNNKKVGRLMTKSQKLFDKHLSYLCKKELTSPILHSLLSDEYLKKLSFGMKGVGSQGDGCIQILAKDSETQEKIFEYLKTKNVEPYKVMVEQEKIKKAVIALCGKGTRLYPYTKLVTKEFTPILHRGKMKPQIHVLLEYIYDSGIRDITIAVSNYKQKENYKKYFLENIDSNSEPSIRKLKNIYKCIHFIIIRDSVGFGDTVLRFKKVSNNEPVLLFLGDTLYEDDNAIKLIKKYYNEYESSILVLSPKSEKDFEHCGMCYGKLIDNELMKITKMVEKPKVDYCKNNMGVNNTYYGIYGIYLLVPEIFNILKTIKDNKQYKKEMGLTEALQEYIKNNETYGVLMKSNSLDFGNIKDYSINFDKLR